MLFAGTRHFGGGSVHLVVVDPGVGSARRRLAIRAGGRYYVGPDNGLFAIVIDEVGLQKAVELAPRPEGAPTFEGRDVFAPAAAALAAGVPLDSLGPPTDPPKMLDASPRVLWIDGFGNLVTNLKPPVRPMRIHNHDITAPRDDVLPTRGRTSRSSTSAAWATSRSRCARRARTGCWARAPAWRWS